MKLFSRLMLLVIIAALIGPFFIKGPDGAPLWRWQDIQATLKKQWHRLGGNIEASIPGDKSVTVYRWRDADGQWQFGSEVPPGIEADTLNIDPNTNVISLPALPTPEPEPQAPAAAAAAPEPARGVGPLPDPEATRKLIEDARSLQDKVDQRDQLLRDQD